MTPLRSLRAKLLLGAVLWTFGLMSLTTLLFTLFPHALQSMVVVHRHGVATAVCVVACLAAGLAVVRRGVAPFDDLRRRVADLREGRQRRLEGAYPREVQPLVDDLNLLLEHHERAVNRAVAKAGDLAHGLKTPLAVLAQEADRAAAAGQHDLAETVSQQVERMRRQMNYHLAQARAAASGATPGARCAVLASADGLTRTMRRLYAERGIAIDVCVDAGHGIRGQREDLDEMLGNLLDNACKWAAARVRVSSALENESVVVTVDDDGPGLAASLREAVLQRGVRADQAAPGSGFGLAIVRDLAELYGGSIALDQSPLGGVCAQLRLPAS
jgi:signal transduction histidine kinase